MSGPCNCFCCQGSGCSTSLAGSSQVSSISECTQNFCINSFSVACKKDVFIGGRITSTFTTSASSPAAIGWPGFLIYGLVFWIILKEILFPKRPQRKFHCENCGFHSFQEEEEEDPSIWSIDGTSTQPSCPRCRRAMLLTSIRIDSYDYCDYGSTSYDHSSSSHTVTTSDETY